MRYIYQTDRKWDIGITYKTAWRKMCKIICEALGCKDGGFIEDTVETDETYCEGHRSFNKLCSFLV